MVEGGKGGGRFAPLSNPVLEIRCGLSPRASCWVQCSVCSVGCDQDGGRAGPLRRAGVGESHAHRRAANDVDYQRPNGCGGKGWGDGVQQAVGLQILHGLRASLVLFDVLFRTTC